MLWEEDIAPSRAEKEWISLDVTELATTGSRMTLRFRVVDKRAVGDHLSVTFLVSGHDNLCGVSRLDLVLARHHGGTQTEMSRV